MAQNVVTSGGNQPRNIASFVQFGLSRRKSAFQAAYGVFFAPLPDDPIGTANVTFSGVTVGSEIHIYLPDGTELIGTESCTINQQLSWPVYAPGSPNNMVTITIIKRGLRWQKFPYQSTVGSSSIPIFPQPDLGYNNPA